MAFILVAVIIFMTLRMMMVINRELLCEAGAQSRAWSSWVKVAAARLVLSCTSGGRRCRFVVLRGAVPTLHAAWQFGEPPARGIWTAYDGVGSRGHGSTAGSCFSPKRVPEKLGDTSVTGLACTHVLDGMHASLHHSGGRHMSAHGRQVFQ